MTSHYAEAERLLVKASQLEDSERFHYAKVYADMAQAHAVLAQVKATRDLTEVLARPQVSASTVTVTGPRQLSSTIEAALTRQTGSAS